LRVVHDSAITDDADSHNIFGTAHVMRPSQKRDDNPPRCFVIAVQETLEQALARADAILGKL